MCCMKKYSVLFFDLDGTLLDFLASEKKAIIQVLKMHNLPHTDEYAEIYSRINDYFWAQYESGKIEKHEIFVNRFCRFLEVTGLSGDAEKISEDYFHCLAEGHDLIDGAKEILTYLKNKGYKIYATTNGIAITQYKRIKDAGIDAFFDGVFVSEQVGCQKPEKEYFEYIINHIGNIDCGDILIIGDRPSSDILGGINAGIDTCWFNANDEEERYKSNYTIKTLYEIKNIL